MAFYYFELSFRAEIVSCVIIFSVGLLFQCSVWIYYTIWKNFKFIATQQPLVHCFSYIIMRVLRNSLITLQNRFLWKPVISWLLGFLSGFVFVSLFLRNVSYIINKPYQEHNRRWMLCSFGSHCSEGLLKLGSADLQHMRAGVDQS